MLDYYKHLQLVVACNADPKQPGWIMSQKKKKCKMVILVVIENSSY